MSSFGHCYEPTNRIDDIDFVQEENIKELASEHIHDQCGHVINLSSCPSIALAIKRDAKLARVAGPTHIAQRTRTSSTPRSH